MRRYKHIYVKGYTSSDSYMIESPEGEYIRMEEGEQVIKWHKVEYGLPAKVGDYLVTMWHEDSLITLFAYFTHECEFRPYLDEASHVDVTHWAELPKPEEAKG